MNDSLRGYSLYKDNFFSEAYPAYRFIYFLKSFHELWPPGSEIAVLNHLDSKTSGRLLKTCSLFKGKNYCADKHANVDFMSLLWEAFYKDPFPSHTVVKKLQQDTGISRLGISLWFKWHRKQHGCISSKERDVQAIYNGVGTTAQLDGELSEWFEVKIGVHQGSVLSPLLLAMAMLISSFKEDQYPESDALSKLADRTGYKLSKLESWYRVSRALSNTFDATLADKEELILWRMFKKKMNTGLTYEDVNLMSDLLLMEKSHVYKIFLTWCQRYEVKHFMQKMSKSSSKIQLNNQVSSQINAKDSATVQKSAHLSEKLVKLEPVQYVAESISNQKDLSTNSESNKSKNACFLDCSQNAYLYNTSVHFPTFSLPDTNTPNHSGPESSSNSLRHCFSENETQSLCSAKIEAKTDVSKTFDFGNSRVCNAEDSKRPETENASIKGAEFLSGVGVDHAHGEVSSKKVGKCFESNEETAPTKSKLSIFSHNELYDHSLVLNALKKMRKKQKKKGVPCRVKIANSSIKKGQLLAMQHRKREKDLRCAKTLQNKSYLLKKKRQENSDELVGSWTTQKPRTKENKNSVEAVIQELNKYQQKQADMQVSKQDVQTSSKGKTPSCTDAEEALFDAIHSNVPSAGCSPAPVIEAPSIHSNAEGDSKGRFWKETQKPAELTEKTTLPQNQSSISHAELFDQSLDLNTFAKISKKQEKSGLPCRVKIANSNIKRGQLFTMQGRKIETSLKYVKNFQHQSYLSKKNHYEDSDPKFVPTFEVKKHMAEKRSNVEAVIRGLNKYQQLQSSATIFKKQAETLASKQDVQTGRDGQSPSCTNVEVVLFDVLRNDVPSTRYSATPEVPSINAHAKGDSRKIQKTWELEEILAPPKGQSSVFSRTELYNHSLVRTFKNIQKEEKKKELLCRGQVANRSNKKQLLNTPQHRKLEKDHLESVKTTLFLPNRQHQSDFPKKKHQETNFFPFEMKEKITEKRNNVESVMQTISNRSQKQADIQVSKQDMQTSSNMQSPPRIDAKVVLFDFIHTDASPTCYSPPPEVPTDYKYIDVHSKGTTKPLEFEEETFPLKNSSNLPSHDQFYDHSLVLNALKKMRKKQKKKGVPCRVKIANSSNKKGQLLLMQHRKRGKGLKRVKVFGQTNCDRQSPPSTDDEESLFDVIPNDVPPTVLSSADDFSSDHEDIEDDRNVEAVIQELNKYKQKQTDMQVSKQDVQTSSKGKSPSCTDAEEALFDAIHSNVPSTGYLPTPEQKNHLDSSSDEDRLYIAEDDNKNE